MNNFDITDIEKTFTDAVRALGISENIWNNRPRALDESVNDFVVVRVVGGVNDKCAFGECRVLVHLYARDIREMKNAKKLSVMQHKILNLPLWLDDLLINGNPRIVGDSSDDFGFHLRIINFHVTIKTV